MKSAFFTLFLTISVLGQPVVGPEVASTPIGWLGDIALAPQRGGFVVAWEAAGHIYAGHLDTALQATGPILAVPLSDPQANATSPAIATNGSTVLVAWQEHHPDVNVVATLNADASVLLYGPRRLNASALPPFAGVADGTYVVYSSDAKYRLNDALESAPPEVIQPGITAAISTLGEVATANQNQLGDFWCVNFGGWGGGDCNPSFAYTFSVPSGKIVKSETLSVKQGNGFSVLPAIVAPNGSAFAALLRRSDKTEVVLFDSAIRLTATLPAIVTQAAIAGNGNDVLIVWAGQGLILHADGSLSQPFTVGPNSLGNPHVVAAGSNEFVVFHTNQNAIAGRVIHLQAPRQRSIR